MGNCIAGTNNPSSDVPGDRVNMYRFYKLEKIGKGGLSLVWKVKDKASSKIYAMKEIKKHETISTRSLHSVLNERRLLSILKHPLIVNAYFAFQSLSNLYLVTEYMEGGDLRYAMTKTPRFQEEEVKFMACCIISAMEYIHTNGIIHGDLKPENLVFDMNGYLKVTDFGTARMVISDNFFHNAGTPPYMAPELLRRQNHTISVDYYALGVILFELITGKRPYKGMKNCEIRKDMKERGTLTVDKSLASKECFDMILSLLELDPSKRLGKNGPSEVKEHPWVKEFDWGKLKSGEIPAPFIPSGSKNYFKSHVNRKSDEIDEKEHIWQDLFIDYYYDSLKS